MCYNINMDKMQAILKAAEAIENISKEYSLDARLDGGEDYRYYDGSAKAARQIIEFIEKIESM